MLAEEVIDEEFEDEEEEDVLAGGLGGPSAAPKAIAAAGKEQAPGGPARAPKVPDKAASKGSDRKKSIAGEAIEERIFFQDSAAFGRSPAEFILHY